MSAMNTPGSNQVTPDDIVEYVMNNPENTNPAVLRDLLIEAGTGSGGSSDFEYAKITVTNTATEPEQIVEAWGYMVEDDFFDNTIIPIEPEQTKIINGVMYKKTLYFYITASEKPTITGNITLDNEDRNEYTYMVSGDCNISAKGISQEMH